MRTLHVLGACVGLVGVLAGAGCAASGDTPASPDPTVEVPDPQASSVAEAITPLPPAAPVPTVVELPSPMGLTVDALGIEAAPVIPVGVRTDGDMEVPGVTEVGWYRFGSRPGDTGSAVLAAHVAYNGQDGVFRHLDDLAAGDRLAVSFADGTLRSFEVTEVTQHPKSELPADVWSRAGAPRLVLITCGGEFDDEADRYTDNIVAFARPVG